MATTSNKIIPVLGTVGAAVIIGVLYQQFSGPAQPKADAPMKAVPDPARAKAGLPKATGADNDTPAETLATVVASNTQLRQDVAKIIETNNRLSEENRRLGGTGGNAGAGSPAQANNPSAASVPAPQATAIDPPSAEKSALGNAIDTAAEAADTLMKGLPGSPSSSSSSTTRGPSTGSQAVPGSRAGAAGWSDAGAAAQADSAAGVVQYKLMTPMGYVAHVDPARGSGAVATTRFVRTTQASGDAGIAGPAGPATQAARAAAQKAEDIPFFTLPENSTLAGVTAMTSLIGRVPIDGRVTDPMQFKAMVGRDNLAASGWELPPDIAGMIVTGVAIGDMALSCSEGKVRSITFVFNDGTVRTVSSRNRGGGISTGSGSGGSSGGDIGFISDLHGNPCIPGKFVTNAASYLTDISMLRGLGVAGQAFADAQRTQRNNNDGSTSSSITGDRGRFAMGQAVSGATDEVTQWMLQRLRNSFDAVIVPSGKQLVIHLDQEIRLDKAVNARRLVHRQQGGTQIARGERHGLE
ncbi:TIGR03752 family integrating conjugative element protein [Acidovorax sp. SUPP2539]|uniref:TIGR03752 family integrating conjugative element protein n=1 Tax=Acidovorax sp. SUPP2539 TaxID=2920878 RepID=UPI0023DE6233|nr:TIGR03752 family integrating conjugative element protein [Acidovorax sp. SUPP2539]GKS92640.1 TIGR03752 family integrating conjugative element protein [Acidovorax sp. SUPP2539]